MTHISDLRGIGIGKTALLIGGGPSSANIPKIGDIRINCNFPFHGERVDYVVYYDEIVESQIRDYPKNYKSIGFEKLGQKPNADYYATIHEDIDFLDTGFHTLQIATKIMQFDQIFLIGYDYKRINDKQHYYNSAEDNRHLYDAWMFTVARHRYSHKDCRCTAEIINDGKCKCKYDPYFAGYKVYNLSPDTALDCFHRICYENN